MSVEVKSEFERICSEDFKQFRDISKRFQNVKMENPSELNQLCIDSWLLATRWSEIQSNASKIAQENGLTKMDFQNWAYQKYRQLQEMHITCRSWFRMAREDEIALRQQEGI